MWVCSAVLWTGKLERSRPREISEFRFKNSPTQQKNKREYNVASCFLKYAVTLPS